MQRKRYIDTKKDLEDEFHVDFSNLIFAFKPTHTNHNRCMKVVYMGLYGNDHQTVVV